MIEKEKALSYWGVSQSDNMWSRLGDGLIYIVWEKGILSLDTSHQLPTSAHGMTFEEYQARQKKILMDALYEETKRRNSTWNRWLHKGDSSMM